MTESPCQYQSRHWSWSCWIMVECCWMANLGYIMRLLSTIRMCSYNAANNVIGYFTTSQKLATRLFLSSEVFISRPLFGRLLRIAKIEKTVISKRNSDTVFHQTYRGWLTLIAPIVRFCRLMTVRGVSRRLDVTRLLGSESKSSSLPSEG